MNEDLVKLGFRPNTKIIKNKEFKGRLLIIYSLVPVLTKELGDNLPYLLRILQRPDKMLLGWVSHFGKSKADLEALYIAEKKRCKLIIKIIILTLKLITTLL